MNKVVTAVVLNAEATRVLLKDKKLSGYTTMHLTPEFLDVMKGILEEITGASDAPIAVLSKASGVSADISKLRDELESFFTSNRVNFVFEALFPQDEIIEFPYSKVMEWNQMVLKSKGMCTEYKDSVSEEILRQARQSLNQRDFEDDDAIGFVSILDFEALQRFCVMDENWELKTKNLNSREELQVVLSNVFN